MESTVLEGGGEGQGLPFSLRCQIARPSGRRSTDKNGVAERVRPAADKLKRECVLWA